jgi:hypothetical protein
MVAVGAVGLESRCIVGRVFGLVAEGGDVAARGLELLLGSLGHHAQAVAQEIEAEAHLLGPRPELACSHGIDCELEIRVQLLAGVDSAIGLVVEDLNRLCVDAVHAVDLADHQEAADVELEVLLDREHARVIDHGVVTEVRAQDAQALVVESKAPETRAEELVAVDVERELVVDAPSLLLGQRPLVEALEHAVEHRAEAERLHRLGLALIDVVQLERERAALEPAQARDAEIAVLERVLAH